MFFDSWMRRSLCLTARVLVSICFNVENGRHLQLWQSTCQCRLSFRQVCSSTMLSSLARRYLYPRSSAHVQRTCRCCKPSTGQTSSPSHCPSGGSPNLPLSPAQDSPGLSLRTLGACTWTCVSSQVLHLTGPATAWATGKATTTAFYRRCKAA